MKSTREDCLCPRLRVGPTTNLMANQTVSSFVALPPLTRGTHLSDSESNVAAYRVIGVFTNCQRNGGGSL